MNTVKSPYISRVRIKNFRNFLDADVDLEHKSVIIGENNVGKTNFLRAIQLILDRDFSDSDRQLSESDFHDSLDEPMKNGNEIEIIINVRGFEHNSKLVAQFDSALVSVSPQTLEFRYKFFPNTDVFGEILSYSFSLYKGTTDKIPFTNEDRKYINIYIIKALRDVERDLKASKNSPLYKLVKKYDIQKDELKEIADLVKEAADGVLDLDEISHIKKTIQERFAMLSGLQTDQEIHLRTFEIDMERLLYSIQVYMGVEPRPVGELSLGLANILYVSLMLILLKDRTVQPIIKPERYDKLVEAEEPNILTQAYEKSRNGNYLLKDGISADLFEELYAFMDNNNKGNQQSFTILAVEEPESHLHPILQRLIYREVLHKSETSVIFTSHSTFITAVCPLDSIVHVRRKECGSSKVYSTVGIDLDDGDKEDIERYIDAKRGEIYFGKAVILTEGITEEYIVPAAAEIQKTPLDDYGILVCNIHSTNFKPYIRILEALNIPWILLTDGDYYEEVVTKDPKSGKVVKNKNYHILSGSNNNYRGNELIGNILQDLEIVEEADIPKEFSDQDTLFRSKGCYIGKYTLEVDIMDMASADGVEIIKKIFAELCGGGKIMKDNFNELIDSKDYWTALERIEQYIGKGRFAQRFCGSLTNRLIPEYVSSGISEIINKVKKNYE